MCHLSPGVHLGWAVLACGLQIVLIQHLWRYDRFKCLKWSSDQQTGSFKRVMTYSYCASVPLLLMYSVSMAVLKYKHGYTMIPGHGIVPTPYQLWPKSDRDWLIPLYLIFSFVWGLEIVTHMEELAFWLFLIHQGPTKREWFSSTEFKIWALVSFVGICGMPLVAIFQRSNPLLAEAYVFLAGSSASTCITAVFFVVLFKFPGFLKRVKREGAAGPVVLRLVRFHELNIMRIIFRLLFTLPILALGIDGISKTHILNESALWTDFLAFIAAFGAVISSSFTLLIFFPRSLAEDSNWNPRSIETGAESYRRNWGSQARLGFAGSRPEYHDNVDSLINVEEGLTPRPIPSILQKSRINYPGDRGASPNTFTSPYYPPSIDAESLKYKERHWERFESDGSVIHEGSLHSLRPVDSSTALRFEAKQAHAKRLENGKDEIRRPTITDDGQSQNPRIVELVEAVDAGMRKPVRPPRLHPYITSFTSPIDLLQKNDEASPRAI